MFNQPDLHQLRAPDPDRAQTVQAWIADPTGQTPSTSVDQASARITPTPSIGVSDLIGAAITSTPSVSLNALTSFGRQLRAGLGHLAQPVQSRDGREQRPTERTARVDAPRPIVEDTRERVVTADTPLGGPTESSASRSGPTTPATVRPEDLVAVQQELWGAVADLQVTLQAQQQQQTAHMQAALQAQQQQQAEQLAQQQHQTELLTQMFQAMIGGAEQHQPLHETVQHEPRRSQQADQRDPTRSGEPRTPPRDDVARSSRPTPPTPTTDRSPRSAQTGTTWAMPGLSTARLLRGYRPRTGGRPHATPVGPPPLFHEESVADLDRFLSENRDAIWLALDDNGNPLTREQETMPSTLRLELNGEPIAYDDGTLVVAEASLIVVCRGGQEVMIDQHTGRSVVTVDGLPLRNLNRYAGSVTPSVSSESPGVDEVRQMIEEQLEVLDGNRACEVKQVIGEQLEALDDNRVRTMLDEENRRSHEPAAEADPQDLYHAVDMARERVTQRRARHTMTEKEKAT